MGNWGAAKGNKYVGSEDVHPGIIRPIAGPIGYPMCKLFRASIGEN